MTKNERKTATWTAWFALATALLMPIVAPGENGKFSNPRHGIFGWFFRGK